MSVFSSVVDESGMWRACRPDDETPAALGGASAEALFVPTADSLVLCELMRLAMRARRALLLVGESGVSKTATASYFLGAPHCLPPAEWLGRTITCTRATTPLRLLICENSLHGLANSQKHAAAGTAAEPSAAEPFVTASARPGAPMSG